MVCRVQRTQGHRELCSRCSLSVEPFLRGHTINKELFINAINVLRETVGAIVRLNISPEYDPWKDATESASVNAPEKVKGGNIDVFLEIIDLEQQKHVFVIELQNTHKEGPSRLTHKFAQVVRNHDPAHAYLVCLRLTGELSVLTPITQRIDIFRRWVIFAILYAKSLPRLNHWWFFWEGNQSPLCNSAEISKFLSQPVRIHRPPKPIHPECDWEFATDVLAGHTRVQPGHARSVEMGSQPDSQPGSQPAGKIYPFDNIVQNSIDVKEVFGQDFPPHYALMDVSKFPDLFENMRCHENCEACKAYFQVGQL